MPRLVITLANPYVAGLILAAPYGAVMSTVSGFLLIISSGLVHDVYQRFLRPTASEREIARASYAATVAVGVVVGGRWRSGRPQYLQLIVVFSSSGMAAAFLMPALLGCFWRRATAPGAIAAMLGGDGRHARPLPARHGRIEVASASTGSSPTPVHRPEEDSGRITCSASTRASGASARRWPLAWSSACSTARPTRRASRSCSTSSPPTPPPPPRSTSHRRSASVR